MGPPTHFLEPIAAQFRTFGRTGWQASDAGFVDSVQVVYNVFDQNPEDELFPACREKNVAVIARVPFDEGSLTGTLSPTSRWPAGDWRNNYFSPESLRNTLQRVDALKPLLRDGLKLPELALRFILSNPDVATVIPGMRKTRNVDCNLAASDRGPLSSEFLAALRPHRWDRKLTPESFAAKGKRKLATFLAR